MTSGRMRSSIAAALRFAWRDLRVVLFDYKVLVLSIAIGVAAVTGVAALTDSFLTGLARDGRALVGGDISFARAQEPLSADEKRFLESQGTISVIAGIRAMVAKGDGETALADIKAVEANYPLVGDISTTPVVVMDALDQGGPGVLADPALLARLGVAVGDTIRIGAAQFAVRAAIDQEPDRLVAGAAFAPRLIMSRSGLDATGLVTPEALVRWTAKLALASPGMAPVSDRRVASVVDDFKKRFLQSGFEIRTRNNATPQIERIVDRITRFLVTMGLLSVVVGGIGVWNAVALFVERQRVPAAIFKTIGASGAFVFGLAMTEILALAALGVLLGVVAGSLLPYAFAPFLSQAGVGTFQASLSARAIAGGAAVGFGAALLFSILPAGSTHDVPGALLLRGNATGSQSGVRLRYRLLALASLLLFVVAISAVSGNWPFAVAIVAGSLALAAFFDGAGRLLARIVRLVPRPRAPVPLLVWTSLSRTSRMARAVVVSLGVGLIILAATSAITTSLRAQLTEGMPAVTPNLFLVGLPSKDDAAFRTFLAGALPDAMTDEAPMMRGRIVEVRGIPAEKITAQESAAWLLEGDRGITFSRTPPSGSALASGEWWPADYAGPPLVSLGADAARGLGLKIGDDIAVNIGGRKLTARIANLRDINWASFGINFVLVFSPKPVEAAPHSMLLTVASRTLDDPAKNAAFVRSLAQDWPSVIAIDVHAMLAQAKTLVDKVALAVQASALFTVLAAAVVLAGAVAADSRSRERGNTILKILGGTRRQLVLASLLEFAALGLATGLFAIVAGNLVAWAILRLAIDTPFVLATGPLLALLAVAVVTIAAFGLVGNWRMLNESPGRVLRRL